jgi:heme-binding protein
MTPLPSSARRGLFAVLQILGLLQGAQQGGGLPAGLPGSLPGAQSVGLPGGYSPA